MSETIQKRLADSGARFIPLLANSKRPARKFKDVTFSMAELNKHIKAGGNMALLVNRDNAPNFVFVDIDTSHGSDGMKSFLNLLEESGLNADEVTKNTLMQQTATNGIHIIYESIEGFNFKQDIGLLDGVDIKASPNNFIVVAPTRIDGVPYKFLNDNDPQPIPKALAEAIQKKATEKKKSTEVKGVAEGAGKVVEGLRYYTPKGADFTVVDPFYTIENGWGESGGRNNVVFKWAQRMRRLTDLDTTLAFADVANDNSAEPMDMSEVSKTIESAFEFGGAISIIERKGYRFVSVGKRNGRDVAVPEEVYQRVMSLNYEDYDLNDVWTADTPMIMSAMMAPEPNSIDEYIQQQTHDGSVD
jgi:Primase C terminal 1 (PriCT-1)./Bifunctional DNA primase/polymerase, N-terminal.